MVPASWGDWAKASEWEQVSVSGRGHSDLLAYNPGTLSYTLVTFLILKMLRHLPERVHSLDGEVVPSPQKSRPGRSFHDNKEVYAFFPLCQSQALP